MCARVFVCIEKFTVTELQLASKVLGDLRSVDSLLHLDFIRGCDYFGILLEWVWPPAYYLNSKFCTVDVGREARFSWLSKLRWLVSIIAHQNVDRIREVVWPAKMGIFYSFISASMEIVGNMRDFCLAFIHRHIFAQLIMHSLKESTFATYFLCISIDLVGNHKTSTDLEEFFQILDKTLKDLYFTNLDLRFYAELIIDYQILSITTNDIMDSWLMKFIIALFEGT